MKLVIELNEKVYAHVRDTYEGVSPITTAVKNGKPLSVDIAIDVIEQKLGSAYLNTCPCSNCGLEGSQFWNFCPRCGVKRKEGDTNDGH